MFVPGAVKYGDVPALLALNAPGKLWLAGDDGVKAVDGAGVTRSPAGAGAQAAVEWLLDGKGGSKR